LTKVWGFRGQRVRIPAAGTNQKLCVYGAINYRSGQTHYLIHPRKNSFQFTAFLEQLLEAKRRQRVVLVLDNASYHVTNKTLAVLASHAHHVFVVWLPKYSPELNAIEGLWGYLKRSGTNNYYFGSVERLEVALDQVFTALNHQPETALSLAYRTNTNLCKSA
jgi:transposase